MNTNRSRNNGSDGYTCESPGEYEDFRQFLSQGERRSLDSQQLADTVRGRLCDSPVPIATLVHFARRSGFSSTVLLEISADLTPSRQEDPQPHNTFGRSDLEQLLDRAADLLGEVREGQSEMARLVMDSLVEGDIALIEAATGTGKSLAYLLPAVLGALEDGARTVVSTHTKNLQDQLITREMVNLEGILGTPVEAVRLLGRENYICSKRLVSRLTSLAEEDPGRALRAGLCAALARDGIAGMIPGDSGIPRLSSITAPQRCRMKGCPASISCPLVKARDRAKRSPLVFVNHALALTDYLQGGTMIGARSSMVFDEAHHLEDSVMENLSVKVTTSDIERILEELSPFDAASDKWKYFAGQLEAVAGRKDWKSTVADAAEAAGQLERSVRAFFDIVTAEYSDGQDLRGARTRYFDGDEAFAHARDVIGDITRYNNKLRETLKPMTEHSLPPAGEAFQSEIEYASVELSEFGERLDFLVRGCDEESVFWIEWSPAGKAFALCGSPLDVGRRFADFVQDSCEAAVLTSATLAQGGSFEYTRSRLGLDLIEKETRELLVDSPFSLGENCLIALQTDLADPREARFAHEVAEVIASLSRDTRRSMLVLLTSYSLCSRVAGLLEDEELAGPLLIQAGRSGREALAARFRSSENPVLLGVASFWEGVDFPGDQLEILIIPKLPFPVPTDPVTEARSDQLRRVGENPFTTLHLPLAIQRLRQGVGRLIRRKDDRGMVVILDPRMASKSYGKIIRASLPVEVRNSGSGLETRKLAVGWFDGKNRIDETVKKG